MKSTLMKDSTIIVLDFEHNRTSLNKKVCFWWVFCSSQVNKEFD